MTVAFIPVRGGSKSIPLKNIKLLNGKPLVFWTLQAAVACEEIDAVYVSTDSQKIRSEVESFSLPKVTVIARSEATASDTASTESAMLEFAREHDFDTIILIQATSPLLRPDELRRGLKLYAEPQTDSVLSVVRQKRFLWAENENGYVHAQNYDYFHRPRRQEFEGYLMENGAFYITSRQALLSTGNRISGNIRACEMRENTAYEIDEPSDWIIIEELMRTETRNMVQVPADIKMLLTDCDGCLTDGGMYYAESGDELKKFNTRDGIAFALLREKGIITGIITGENCSMNQRRAEKIQADILRMGVKNKLDAVREVAEQYNVSLHEIAYIGDDVNDIPVLQNVGWSCCPADAQQDIKKIVDYTAQARGGEGAVREVAERLLIL